jgi:hypothetical protein
MGLVEGVTEIESWIELNVDGNVSHSLNIGMGTNIYNICESQESKEMDYDSTS